MLTAIALALPVEFLVLQIACTYVALRFLDCATTARERSENATENARDADNRDS
jgi:hypothetical protein